MRSLRRLRDSSGFTLIEALLSVALMGIVLGALAMLTAQWFPNWNRGIVRLQGTEKMGAGIERAVADLAAAEFVSANGKTKRPLFEGAETSVVFVRSALGPNAPPGLEIVRLSEAPAGNGLSLVRTRAPFRPLEPGVRIGAQVAFADPVVLTQGPFRVSFSYAGRDRAWKPVWTNEVELPRAVRLIVRSTTTGQVVMVSTSTLLHVTASADCAQDKNPAQCLEKLDKDEDPDRAQATPSPAPQAGGQQL